MTSLPEVVEYQEKEASPSQGLEVAGADAKELRRASAQAPDGPQAIDAGAPEVVNARAAGEVDDVPPSQKAERKKLWILIGVAVVLIACLAIGLGAGLGVGVKDNNKQER